MFVQWSFVQSTSFHESKRHVVLVLYFFILGEIA